MLLLDASAYTFGVRVDYLAYDAGILVVPYILKVVEYTPRPISPIQNY